jgi:chromate reductase
MADGSARHDDESPGQRLRVLAVAGSLRERSYNRGLLRAAIELAPHTLTIDTFELDALPHYNADLSGDDVDPPPVRAWKDAIARADGLLLAVPEYNHSFSGVLKNAIDWASRRPTSPLEGRPIGIFGASDGPFGTARAQASIRSVLAATGSLVMVRPAVMVPFVSEVADAEGDIAEAGARERITAFMNALADWVCQMRQETDPDRCSMGALRGDRA